MSAEATGWVFRHSPTTGVMRLVHLAMADSVNDQNDNEFWMSQANLAKKAGSSRSATQGALRWLIDLGYITLLEDNSKAGKPNRYRFEFLEGVPGDKAPPARPQGTQVPGHRAQTQRTTQAEESTRKRIDDAFAEFWEIYPRKTAKKRSLAIFERAVLAAPKGQRHLKCQEIIEGARRYARAMASADQKFIKQPDGWLGGERWTDVIAMTAEEDDQARLIREYNSVQYVSG